MQFDRIQTIADTYGLKVIYDAAHAFGVRKDGESILNFGDMSILSFHATKIYNTFEGGAVVSHDEKTKKRIDYLKNFGFAGETTVVGPGINSKMNEFQAALGLLQLKYIDKNIIRRKEIWELYNERLSGITGIRTLSRMANVRHNYSYFPIFVDQAEYGMTRDELYEKLKRNGIFARRYFYPLISNFPTYRSLPSSNKNNLSIANEVSERVICLPMYEGLENENVNQIIDLINGR